jgi:hypothetical protein
MRFLFCAIVIAGFALPSAARAHEGRPVNIQIKEREPGLFQVQWQVPKALPVQAMPSPVLPEPCRKEGERLVVDQPGARLNRQLYRCPDGLAGKTLEIHYPVHNPSLTTLVRVEFLTGESYAHVLGPAERSWRIPGYGLANVAAPLLRARAALLDGARHVFSTPVHVVFLLVVSLLGMKRAFRLVTAFFLGQLLAMPVVSGFGLGVDPALSEVGLAVAVVLLANEALKPGGGWKQPVLIVTAAGLLHGFGVGTLVPPHPVSGEVGWPGLFSAVVGMDAVLLILAAGLSALVSVFGSLVPRRLVLYGTGALAFALALSSATIDPGGEATATQSALRLPGISSGSDGLTASQRVAPKRADAPIESFLAVEPFEVRHEVLIRLDGLETLPAGFIEIPDQPQLAKQLGELVATSTSVRIDGEEVVGAVVRTDFMTVGERGALPRPTPVREEVAEAVVGVTMSYLTPETPRTVELSWKQFPGAVPSIPTTVIDPEASLASMVTPGVPSVRWENTLADDPIPTVREVKVESARFPLPLLSLPFFALSLFLIVAATRRKRPALSFSLARVSLALGLLIGPWADVAVPVPSRAAPSTGEARRILAGVLPNVYRAFEFRDESAAYDRLAVSVTGETLTEVYLDHRKALEMEERGGARACVDAVEVLEVSEVLPLEQSGFSAQASWTVGGTVTHFGHRHFRQNRYDARVEFVPVDGKWKIRSIDVLEQERVR